MKKLKAGLKIYLSGAVTGTNDYIERFAEAERFLKEHGNVVVLNPVGETCKNYAEYMERAMKLLKDADAMFTIIDENYACMNSLGVEFERRVAERIRIPNFWYYGGDFCLLARSCLTKAYNALFEEVEK